MIIKSAQAFLDDEGAIDHYLVQFEASGETEFRHVVIDPFNRHYVALLQWLDEGNELLPPAGQ